jgi:hypothetical protein
MEYWEKINDKLGEKNVGLLLKEIKSGKIIRDKVKQIALLMHDFVHDVYVEKERNSDNLENVFYHILDSWYNHELSDPKVNSQARLYDILVNPRVDLVHMMELNQDQQGETSKESNHTI